MTQGPRLARSFLFSRKTKKDDNGTVRANIWATTLQQKACTQERVDDDINVLPRLFARGRPLVPAGCDINYCNTKCSCATESAADLS